MRAHPATERGLHWRFCRAPGAVPRPTLVDLFAGLSDGAWRAVAVGAGAMRRAPDLRRIRRSLGVLRRAVCRAPSAAIARRCVAAPA
jgi:hypothetical protein